jgi:hypothetical protein
MHIRPPSLDRPGFAVAEPNQDNANDWRCDSFEFRSTARKETVPAPFQIRSGAVEYWRAAVTAFVAYEGEVLDPKRYDDYIVRAREPILTAGGRSIAREAEMLMC